MLLRRKKEREAATLLAGLPHRQHDSVDANPHLGKALWRQIDPLAAPAGPEARRPCAKLDMRRRFVDLGRGGQDRAQRAPRFQEVPCVANVFHPVRAGKGRIHHH